MNPHPAGAALQPARASWWDNPERLNCDEKVWPKRIPNAEAMEVLDRLVQNGQCPIVSYMVWDICHANNSTDQVNAGFRKLCEKFNVFQHGFGPVADAARDATVMKSVAVTYPKHPQAYPNPPPAGSGYHTMLSGEPRKYAKSVANCVNSGGNGGVIANGIQDFLENTRANGSDNGQISLSFLFDKTPEYQKHTLHDLTVIKHNLPKEGQLWWNKDDKDSKTVKHGVDMMRCLQPAAGSLRYALESYLIESLEEEAFERVARPVAKRFSVDVLNEKKKLLEEVRKAAAAGSNAK